MHHERIYLDYAAASPLRPEVERAMLPYLTETWGNPGSLHAEGRRAAAAATSAREHIASILGVREYDITMTGSGTEANALAILGVLRSHTKHRYRHLIVSSLEHASVLSAARMAEEEGVSVTYLPVDEHGLVSTSTLMRAITPYTVLISIMYANNEIGTIEPIREITSALRTLPHRPYVHTDACQALGQLPTHLHTLGVDLVTLNGAKIGGPKGVGVLARREGVKLSPLIPGGGQEYGLRGGTENVAHIVGMAQALTRAEAERVRESERLSELRDACIEHVRSALPEALLNGHPTKRLPNNIHLTIPGVEGESLALLLDEAGIAVSTGSACSAHDLAPSHVLRAIGHDERTIHGSIRITLGRTTRKGDLAVLVRALRSSVRRLRELTPSYTCV